MEKKDSVWIPKEYRQKEIIAFHLPIIKRPITARQVIFFVLGLPFGIALFFISFKLLHPEALTDKIPIIMFSIAVPFGAAILSTKKDKGKYIDEIIFTKLSHKKTASMTLNEKSLRAYKNNNLNCKAEKLIRKK